MIVTGTDTSTAKKSAMWPALSDASEFSTRRVFVILYQPMQRIIIAMNSQELDERVRKASSLPADHMLLYCIDRTFQLMACFLLPEALLPSHCQSLH